MSADHSSSYAQLKSKSSLADILAVAVEFERTAHNFYSDLATKVSKNLRYLVEELAEEEQGHIALFSKLTENPALVELLKAEVERPANDHKFSDCIHLPELGEKPDDQAVLQYALMREQTAMEQYSALAKSTAPGPIQLLFQFLANEETKHKNELEKIYYKTVHNGGV
ncbi:MAG: ferritin family protein [Sedimenticola sp.]